MHIHQLLLLSQKPFLTWMKQENDKKRKAIIKSKKKTGIRQSYVTFHKHTGLLVQEKLSDPNTYIIIVPENCIENQSLIYQNKKCIDRSVTYSGFAAGEMKMKEEKSDYKITFYFDTPEEYKKYVNAVMQQMQQQVLQ